MVTALSSGEIRSALLRVGQDPSIREKFVEFLKKLEPSFAREGLNVREEVTGPIVDALYAEGELVTKTLSSGVVLTFPYRSKIARDFVMADEHPDHAWEPQTTKLLLLLGKGARNVIIGGAYFGDQAIPLAHSIAATGGVCHCFDINHDQLKYLAQNALQNHLNNVRINECGLWDMDNRRLVLVGDDSHAYSKETADTNEPNSFPTLSIDTYATREQLETIDLIMLDIEGAELAALRGAKRFLAQESNAPSIIFEVHRSYTDWSNGLQNADVCAFLIGFGYQLYAVRDYQSNVHMPGRPIELVPIDDIYLEGPPHGFNIFATKAPQRLSHGSLRILRGVSPKLLFHRDPRLHQPQS